MAPPSKPVESLLAELRDAPPYPGLRPFLPEESKYFRGREQQILEIGQRLADQGCVAVLGGSGSGKSSIIRAGVIPSLRRKLIPGRGDLWRTALFTPGLAPIDNLVAALEATLDPASTAPDRRAKIREVLYGASGLGGFLPSFGGELDVDPGLSARALERANLLVVVDQFEELFRSENLGKPQVARLVDLVIDYWKRRADYPGLYLALTMRTDDLHRCAEFIELPEFINATSYLTRRLKEEELREAIVAPVRPPMFRAGLLEGATEPGMEDLRPYEVRVVTELLDAVAEIAHDPDHLPLLQHLLAVMWRLALDRWERQGVGNGGGAAAVTRNDLAAALGLADWDALEAFRDRLGAAAPRGWILRRCLEYVADALHQGELFGPPLNAAQQDIARIAFCLMGDLDDRGSFKRRWTTEEEIARVSGMKGPTQDTGAFVRRFSDDHRLIWQREAGEIDVCHEALMRNWPRLAGWLRKDRDAAAAYRELDRRYRQWSDSWNRGWRWMSWLAHRNGLLPYETLEHIAPLLAKKSDLGFGAKPLYRSYWTRRAICADDTDDQRSYARTPATPQENARIEHDYGDRFDYLRASMVRSKIFTVLPWMALVSALIGSVIAGRWWHEIADQQRKFVASVLWDGLEGWNPVASREYVDTLWKIATAKPDIRVEMVRQLPAPSNVRQMGFRPQPIIRAIGLRWPKEAEDLISRKWQERLADSDQGRDRNPAWTESHLACATAALADRLTAQCKQQAISHFDSYLSQQSATPNAGPQSLWSNGRILGCLSGAQMLDSKRLDKGIDATLDDVGRNLDAGTAKDPQGLGSIASAVTQAVWLLRSSDGSTGSGACGTNPGRDSGFPNERRNLVLRAIREITQELKIADNLAPLAARPLVSLIAALPCDLEREALAGLLAMVDKRTVPGATGRAGPPGGIEQRDRTLDTLLILAQGFEIVAEQHRKAGVQRELLPLIDRGLAIRALADTPPEQQHEDRRIGELIAARWVAPLLEAAGGEKNRQALLDTLGVVDCRNLADFLAPGHSGEPAGGFAHVLHSGLAARLAAACAASDGLPQKEDRARLFDAAVTLMQYANLKRSGAAGPMTGESRSGTDLASTQTGRPAGIGGLNFGGEAIARLIEALAKGSVHPEARRKQALETAQTALAATGSAEEAAAWARAITSLLAQQDDTSLVKQVVELLRYPTSALTAREWSALEPQNATDVFIGALMRRQEIARSVTDADPRRPGYFRRVLGEIQQNPKFSCFSLESPPKDPRPSSDPPS